MAAFSSLILDPLYCQERHWEAEDLLLEVEGQEQELERRSLFSAVEEEEEQWAELLSTLVTKEQETYIGVPDDDDDRYLHSARRGAVEWVTKACARHGFAALTAVLAVGYLDRFFLGAGGLRLRADRPWMGRLSAVACLSLAAKVEETCVPFVVDLQAAAAEDETDAAGPGYVFEAKTVRRMELLVLSTLGWRMNAVTPLSFIYHLLPKLVKLGTPTPTVAASRLKELLLSGCHSILLSVLADWRWVRYPPSVWAAATLLHAMGEPGSGASSEYNETHRPLALLNLTKERVEGCYQLILGSMDNGVDVGFRNKRKLHSSCYYHEYHSSPPSPNGVIGSCFSCDSSSSGGDSWPVSSSPEPPPFKRPNCRIAGD